MTGVGNPVSFYFYSVFLKSLTFQLHFKEHDWFSTGIQQCDLTELWDEGDLAPDKLYLPPEITTFTWRVERMFPGQWG